MPLSLDQAVLATQKLIGWAILLQNIEYFLLNKYALKQKFEFGITKKPYLNQNFLAIAGIINAIALLVLRDHPEVIFIALLLSLTISYQYQGSFNGGSDSMTHLVLLGLGFSTLFGPGQWQQQAGVYFIAVQSLFSYTIAGWVKLKNPLWRNGESLKKIILESNYDLPITIKSIAAYWPVLKIISWTIIIFEVLFLYFLYTCPLVTLICAALFHLLIFYLFGLNRFFWVWLSTYPSLFYLCEIFRK
jgi:hypothetical protein